MKKLIEVLEAPFSTDEAKHTYYSIFLGGTIDNGSSRDWQAEVIERFLQSKQIMSGSEKTPLKIFNPRHAEWDSSATNHVIKEQIEWELNNVTVADTAIIWLEPESVSVISMLEIGLLLGLNIKTYNDLIIGCPPEYFRALNVYTTIDWFTKTLPNNFKTIQIINNFDELVEAAITSVSEQLNLK